MHSTQVGMNGTADGNNVDPNDEISLRDVWSLLRRNWALIVGVLLLVAGSTGVYSMWTVPVYEAVTTIRIDEKGENLPVLDALTEFSSGSQVATEMEVVRSRSIAEAVVDSLGLQVVLKEPRGVSREVILGSIYVERWAPSASYELLRQPDGSFEITDAHDGSSLGTVSTSVPAAVPGATFTLEPAATDHERIVVVVHAFDLAVQGLQDGVSVGRPSREADIITVRYQNADTQLVHDVPNAIAARFMSGQKADRKAGARSTVAFLTQQIDTLARQLNAAEEALTGFRELEQVVSLSAEADAQVTQLTRLQASRNEIEAERDALQKLVDEIEREAATADPSAPSPFGKLISFPTLFRNSAASELLRTLNDANSARSDLLRRRTTEDPDVIALTKRIHEIEAQLRSTAVTYLRGLENQVQGYDQMLKRFQADLERIPAKEVQLARLQRQQNVLEEVYTTLQNRLQEARILEAVDDATVRIVDPAILPSRPVRPRRLINVLLGIMLGGMLGVAIAFLREYMDETVHTREDIQAAVHGATMLGMIPRIRGAHQGGHGSGGDLSTRLITGRDPRDPASEAYRSLRTNLTFASPDDPPKTLVFSSALPQDGKSTTVANLAVTLAQQGINALVVDADLRRGVMDQVFGVGRAPGLTTILTGQCRISDAIQTVDLGESGTLSFMPSGLYPPNPAEILGSQRMQALIDALEERFDMILIDSAPLTVVTDSAVLGTKADGVVLVARANATAKGALTYAVDQLRNVRARILGCVLNDVDFRRDARYYGSGMYGYVYGRYGDAPSNGKKPKRSGAGASRG